MTTRDEFEKWAFQHELLLNESCVHQGLSVLPKCSTTGKYISPLVDMAWDAWQARQQEIDALKAEIERLKSGDHIADISKMILPSNQSEHKLDMVEPLVRYCPGCGSIGPVDNKYLDCCPDGSDARMIPQALAEKCQHTFRSAIKKITARARAIDNPNEDAPDAPMKHANGREE